MSKAGKAGVDDWPVGVGGFDLLGLGDVLVVLLTGVTSRVDGREDFPSRDGGRDVFLNGFVPEPALSFPPCPELFALAVAPVAVDSPR